MHRVIRALEADAASQSVRCLGNKGDRKWASFSLALPHGMSNSRADVARLLDWLIANPHAHRITTMFLYSLCAFDQALLDKAAEMVARTPQLVVLNFGETGEYAHALDWSRFLDALEASSVSYLYLSDDVKRAVDAGRVREALRRNRYKPAARAIFVEEAQPRGLIGPASQSTRLWWPPHATWMWRTREIADRALCRRVFDDDALFDELKRRVVASGVTKDAEAIAALMADVAAHRASLS